MGRRKHPTTTRSHTLPSSPTHSFSSSSSDFEFTISLSPRKSSAANLCPADELFYKGQLLPLHLSPRISMVRTLLASSSSSSISSSSASRDSTASSNDSRSSFSSDLLLLPECDSSRPSSVTDQDDEYKRLTSLATNNTYIQPLTTSTSSSKKTNYFSLSRLSSVFRKESNIRNSDTDPDSCPLNSSSFSSSSVKRMSSTAKDVIRKYLKKVKPLYEMLSQNSHKNPTVTKGNLCMKADVGSVKYNSNNTSTMIGLKENVSATITHSFSGNLRYPRRRNIVSSCPSSIKSSPSHSGILSRNKNVGCNNFQDSSSMEELQSAIQGAIAHCKNSMMQEK